MRYAMIMAGGSGTRLWPMSTRSEPKQLIPFIGGRSLLQIAMDRLEGLVDPSCRLICAGRAHRELICDRLPEVDADRYFAEPVGRDTLNAVGLVAAVLHRRDPEAVVAVFTADHLIEPVEVFADIVRRGFDLAEARDQALVTFGVAPTDPATGYGYLELGEPIAGHEPARAVHRFKEKPDADTAARYLEAGPERYLWNSGMFVWRAATLMRCIERFAPDNHNGLQRIAQAWDTPRRDAVLDEVYPELPKTSIDYAVMEPAAGADDLVVATLPMAVQWMDVGSWPSYAAVCEADDAGNARAAGRAILHDSAGTLVVSHDNEHLIATVGVDNLIVVHTPHATLVCHRDHAEKIKDVHGRVGQEHGQGYV
jgi:mannose-1-phosphate guanylyltransferase